MSTTLFAASQTDASPIVAIILFSFFAMMYMLPSVIAYLRGHPNAAAITVLTFFLGWTMLGWVIGLVWSFTEAENKPCLRERYRFSQDDDDPRQWH